MHISKERKTLYVPTWVQRTKEKKKMKEEKEKSCKKSLEKSCKKGLKKGAQISND
jgi:hypothetical protein